MHKPNFYLEEKRVFFILFYFIFFNIFNLFNDIIHVPGQMDRKVHIHWKGAAEIVLNSCTRYLDSNGCLQFIDDVKVRTTYQLLVLEVLAVYIYNKLIYSKKIMKLV